MIFNILVATDYSKPADNATLYAVQLAAEMQAKLRFLHVFEPVLYGTSSEFDPDKVDVNPLVYEHNTLKKHIESIVDAMHLSVSDINYECVVRSGKIKKQVLEEADEAKSDLIIVGTHAARNPQEMTLGTHTLEIIRESKKPVLAIPDSAVYSPIKKLVFAAKYRDNEIVAIRLLTTIAEKFNATINVIHVSNEIISDDVENLLFDRFSEEVKNEIAYKNLNLVLIRHTDIVKGLNEYCSNTEVSWLVLSQEKRSFFDKIFYPVGKSITREMSLRTHTPLLVLSDVK